MEVIERGGMILKDFRKMLEKQKATVCFYCDEIVKLKDVKKMTMSNMTVHVCEKCFEKRNR